VTPSVARAQWIVTGFAGGDFAGSAIDAPRPDVGGAIGYAGPGVGFEVELSFSPDFFPESRAVTDPNVTGHVSTLMGSLLVGPEIGPSPAGSVMPYGAVGVGWLRTSLQDPDDLAHLDSNNLGLALGGGVIGFITDTLGVRGDLRYLRNLQEPERDPEFDFDLGTLEYWRFYGGVVWAF
jgi:opacity protein-like surface antigen